MREYLARDALRDQEGVWFFDHDTFLLSPSEAWFEEADRRFSNSQVCICTRRPRPNSGVTQPAYWLSPRRWPEGLSSFAPVPFEPKIYSRRPDLYQHDGDLTIPAKDTLVQAREELDALNMAGTFPTEGDDKGRHFLDSFPQHVHLGGIHIYTGPCHTPAGMPRSYLDWQRHTLMSFDAFFQNCPEIWISAEDPELLRRHAEMIQTIGLRQR
jgi:hypothetical protein